MKVEIWFDYVCPFSYLGKRNFEIALANLSYRNQIKVEYKSFELAPDIEIRSMQSYYQILANKLGVSLIETKETLRKMNDQATKVGLEYCFDKMKPANTFHAHRITQYAMKCGKASELTDRLLKAYFTDAAQISDSTTLIKLATEVGLDEEEVVLILQSSHYAKQVRADEDEGQSIGITSVPFFVFHEKYAVPGVQSVDVFTEVLEEVWQEVKEEYELRKRKQPNTTYCTGDHCE